MKADKKIIQEWIDGGAHILDVRTPEEFEEGSYANSIHIPLQELDTRLKELPAKDEAIVLYCRSGVRSQNALGFLASQGFTKLLNAGGLVDMP